MVSAGVVVYSEEQAALIADLIDGKVDYILVDAEKKIPHHQDTNELANVERTVREHIKLSTLWMYKGNDLSVDAVDGFLAQLTKNDVRGIGGKQIVILGAGNVGFKLALRFVERGAHVLITRRNQEALQALVKAINIIKPAYTQAVVEGCLDNAKAAKGAQVVIGTSDGVPMITSAMIDSMAQGAIIIDVGKGVLYPEAFVEARKRGIDIYRLDISAAFEGLVHHLWAVEQLVNYKLGRKDFYQEHIISGGLLGAYEDIVVDNVHDPKQVYGMADGKGDFIRRLEENQLKRLEAFKRLIEQGDLSNV
jgi:hypothetical protein